MPDAVFYLGTHKPEWLGRTEVPLFLSRRRLAERKLPKMATGYWALDSGGFTQLSLYGRWTISAKQYVDEVRRWVECPGKLRWAAAMDWMCEPFIVAKTGLSVSEHQKKTLDNYLELIDIAPELPWVPVLQGWHYEDYLEHLRQYEDALGKPLSSLDLVGLGSVCRRQDTSMAEELIADLSGRGIRLHGFGFKVKGLERVGKFLASADSMAWSLAARRSQPLPGCKHASCANCLIYALRWREHVLRVISSSVKPPPFLWHYGEDAA